ncbi:MAG: hypothetical protein ACRYG4_00505, partial [Janthinobacterium lividum]
MTIVDTTGAASLPAKPPGIRAIAAPLYTFSSATYGITTGFTTVTLCYVLASRGFSVAAIAGLVGLFMLPFTWRVLVGPVFDLSLTPRHWFLLSAIGSAISIGLCAIVPLVPANVAIIGVMALAMGIFSTS